MSERIHALAQHLLHKSSVEDCSLEELQHLTKRYPFFAPTQFLLLQKLKEAGSPDAVAQQRKAVLYYHDPLQFDHFLSGDAFAMDDLFPQEKIGAAGVEPGTITAAPAFLPGEDLLRTKVDSVEEEQPDLPVTEEVNSVEAPTVFPDPDIITETSIEPSTEPPILPVAPLPEEQPVAIETKEETQLSASPAAESSVAETPVTKAEEVAPESPVNTPIIAVQIEVPAPAAGTEMLFEPFHTVDFFASQGIKISATELPKDKLSKQLRSFTEWLKVMKRLPAAEMGQTSPSNDEKSVVNLANQSVEGSEIVTEAMAEVWAKQGAREKAIETYNKLSLLNPPKRAYFAAKIENLKGS